MSWNSKQAVTAWVEKVLAESELDRMTREILLQAALEEIRGGGLRGDVTAVWKSLGYGTGDLPDLYP